MLIAASVVVLVACGSAARNDRHQIREALHQFAAAQARGDGRTACSFLTLSAKNSLILFVGRYTLPVRPTCEQAISSLPHLVGSRLLRSFASASTRVTSIKGKTASAELVTHSVGAVPVKLERDGAWKISAIPGLASR